MSENQVEYVIVSLKKRVSVNWAELWRYRDLFFALLLLYALLFCGRAMAFAESAKKATTVVLRFDDYSANSNTKIEKQIIEILKKHQAKAVFAVIPYVCERSCHDCAPQKNLPLTTEKIEIMKDAIEAGVIDVALHGYSHQTIDADSYSEFAGESYNKQLLKIEKGKHYLELIFDVPIDCFVPPWNSYDKNTCKAMVASGISLLSAGIYGTAYDGIRFLPSTTGLGDLRTLVRKSLSSAFDEDIIVALFHSHDFFESDDSRATMSLKQFDDLVGWLSSQKGVRISTFSELNAAEDLSVNRYIANNTNRPKYTLLLPSFFKIYDDGIYLSLDSVHSTNRTMLGRVFLFYVSLLAVGLFVGRFTSRFIRIKSVYLLLMIAAILAVSVFKLQSAGLGPKFLIVGVLVASFAIGMLRSEVGVLPTKHGKKNRKSAK